MRPTTAALAGVLLSLLAACSINTEEVVEPAPVSGPAASGASGDGSAGATAEEARRVWRKEPLTADRALLAYSLAMTSVRATPEDDPARFDRLVDAARYAGWLARVDTLRGSFADSALVVANTLVAGDSTRVEGWYRRAIAAGLVGRDDRLRGRSAMARIRTDARRAIEIDPGHDGAGPHRVLGALYLRAPGPPTGVGSLRRALRHLERAVELAPDEAENLLFLAEAYLEDGRPDEAGALLDRAEPLLRSLRRWKADRLRERRDELRRRVSAGEGGRSRAPARA